MRPPALGPAMGILAAILLAGCAQQDTPPQAFSVGSSASPEGSASVAPGTGGGGPDARAAPATDAGAPNVSAAPVAPLEILSGHDCVEGGSHSLYTFNPGDEVVPGFK